jgi:hypothetical protein
MNAERLQYLSSSAAPQKYSRGMPCSFEPNFCIGSSGSKSHDGSVVVGVNLVFTAFQINGYEFAIVFLAKCRPDPTSIHLCGFVC